MSLWYIMSLWCRCRFEKWSISILGIYIYKIHIRFSEFCKSISLIAYWIEIYLRIPFLETLTLSFFVKFMNVYFRTKHILTTPWINVEYVDHRIQTINYLQKGAGNFFKHRIFCFRHSKRKWKFIWKKVL